jgi:hypothetical protein
MVVVPGTVRVSAMRVRRVVVVAMARVDAIVSVGGGRVAMAVAGL